MSLQETSRLKFWEALDDNHKEVEAHLKKLFNSKGVQSSLQLELIHVVYCVCCNKFVDYDPSRASFSTWVVMWGRAIAWNYTHNTKKGDRSPLSGDLVESDIFTQRSKKDNEEVLENEFQRAQDDQALYGDKLDREMVVGWAVKEYLDASKDHDRHTAILQTMLAYGFEVSDRTIANETGLSRVEVKRVKGEILFELGLRLLRLGITPEDR